MRNVSRKNQARALALVAEWIGPLLGLDGPAPTGEAPAREGRGPVLVPAWEPTYGGRARPALILEGALPDWAPRAQHELAEPFARLGIFAEAASASVLQLYPL